MRRNRPETQKSVILRHLVVGESLSPIEALERYGCFRLASRIHDLKRDGWIIDSTRRTYIDSDGVEVTHSVYRIDRNQNEDKIRSFTIIDQRSQQ